MQNPPHSADHPMKNETNVFESEVLPVDNPDGLKYVQCYPKHSGGCQCQLYYLRIHFASIVR